MNEGQLFNRQMGVKKAYDYIRSKGMVVSQAVRANALASKTCVKFSKKYEASLQEMTHKGEQEQVFNWMVAQAQIGNAFSWMMIKTAIDEFNQKWRYIEDGDDYIESIIDKGVAFTDEQRKNITLIRYMGELNDRVHSGKYFNSFKYHNIQYWYMRLNDLDKEAKNV